MARCPWRGRGDGPVALATFFHLRMGDDESMVEAAVESSSASESRLSLSLCLIDDRLGGVLSVLSCSCFSLLLSLQQSSFQLCFV